MISPWLISCDASLCENGAQENAIEQVKKNRFDFYRCAFSRVCSPIGDRNQFARRKNPITGLKKKTVQIHRHSFGTPRVLIGRQDRFDRRKNPFQYGRQSVSPVAAKWMKKWTH